MPQLRLGETVKRIARIRRAIDREWIRVGWKGTQTSKHRLMSLGPLLIFTIPTLIVEPFSYGAAGAFFLTGFCLTVALSLWIEGRRMAGTGSFSSRRSERFAKRSRKGREGRDPTADG
jgi:hypothetical protein